MWFMQEQGHRQEAGAGRQPPRGGVASLFLWWTTAAQALWKFWKRFLRTHPQWDGKELGYFTGQREMAFSTEYLAPVSKQVLG